jgi:tetratricopeptide (TPR) repeat protein
LGSIASSTGRNEEAENWYKRAIEACHRANDKYHEAMCLNALADLTLSQNRLDEAEAYARRALAIKETLDLSSEPWTTYSILAELAEKRGRMDEVRLWRRKEQESFAAFAGSDTQIKQFEPLIAAIVQAANGDEKAKAYLEGEYSKMQSADEWRLGGQAFQRLVAGERNFESLTEGLSRTQSLIIRRILQALNGEGSDPHPPAPSPIAKERAIGEGGQAQQQGVTLPQLLDLVERAAGGDRETGSKLFPAMQKMASDPTAPREMQLLGKALAAIIIGDKNPSLDGLPDEVASAVRGLLGRLKNK